MSINKPGCSHSFHDGWSIPWCVIPNGGTSVATPDMGGTGLSDYHAFPAFSVYVNGKLSEGG
jgi:hypothetical protein